MALPHALKQFSYGELSGCKGESFLVGAKDTPNNYLEGGAYSLSQVNALGEWRPCFFSE